MNYPTIYGNGHFFAKKFPKTAQKWPKIFKNIFYHINFLKWSFLNILAKFGISSIKTDKNTLILLKFVKKMTFSKNHFFFYYFCYNFWTSEPKVLRFFLLDSKLIALQNELLNYTVAQIFVRGQIWSLPCDMTCHY